MRGLIFLILVLGTVSFLLPLDLPTNDPDLPTQDKGTVVQECSEQQIRADLRIQVDLHGLKTLSAGETPWMTASLVNTSQSVTHRVVKPGDGSEVGWREPYCFVTATVDCGDGKPNPLPKADYGRCGLFDADWTKDAIHLRPGDKLSLGYVVLPEFQQAGRVHLRFHYTYGGGNGARGQSPKTPDQLGLMAGVPNFEITSAPVVFDVVRPLDVRVKVKKALRANKETRLPDLIEVVLVNQSPEPVECSSPISAASLHFRIDIDGQYGGWKPILSEQGIGQGICRMLKPGDTVSLLGPDKFANGLDGTWIYPAEDIVKVRAVYGNRACKPGASIQSDWVKVRVEK